MITIGVADDQAMVREGLSVMINAEADLRVVLTAANGQELLDALTAPHARQPDLILLDLRMPVLDGLAVLDRLQHLPHRPAVLVVTTFERDEIVLDALARGADGYVLKRGNRAELIRAVRLVAAGGSMLAPEVTPAIVSHLRQQSREQPRRDDTDLASFGLTPRETEVLRLVGEGLTNDEIARTLSLSIHTVKTHLTSVLAKTRSRDRVQAALMARRLDLP